MEVYMSRFVTWVPKKNSEKTAVSKFGQEWEVNSTNIMTNTILIHPINNKDDNLRWINKSQVTNSRWEFEPL